MSHKQQVLDRLAALNIPFEHYEHEAAPTIEACLALPYAAPDVTFCKNILLCNRQQTAFYLLVMPPQKPFRTSEVSKLLGSSRLSFAPSECLPQMLGLESGALSPLGLWFDEDRRITLVFDREVRQEGRIAFHPCDYTVTCIFPQQVFFEQVLPSLAHETVWIGE